MLADAFSDVKPFCSPQAVSHEDSMDFSRQRKPLMAQKRSLKGTKQKVKRITAVKQTKKKSAIEDCQSKQSFRDVQQRKYSLPSCHSDIYN